MQISLEAYDRTDTVWSLHSLTTECYLTLFSFSSQRIDLVSESSVWLLFLSTCLLEAEYCHSTIISLSGLTCFAWVISVYYSLLNLFISSYMYNDINSRQEICKSNKKGTPSCTISYWCCKHSTYTCWLNQHHIIPKSMANSARKTVNMEVNIYYYPGHSLRD